MCVRVPHLQVAQEACEQLPPIMRIIRQPDVLNEAYAFRYPARPWPLSHVPQTTEVGSCGVCSLLQLLVLADAAASLAASCTNVLRSTPSHMHIANPSRDPVFFITGQGQQQQVLARRQRAALPGLGQLCQ